ncbi:MAG: hypothetical protein AAF639_46840 [Chloroflexota bacterium]
MVVRSKQKLRENVAQRWAFTYARRGEWPVHLADKKAVYDQLIALSDDASDEQIVDITGSDRWTRNLCHQCRQDSEVTVGFGSEIHHPTDTTYICLGCLRQAIEKVQS